MFRLREFFSNFLRLLLVGDGWGDRLVRLALLGLTLGVWAFLKEPIHVHAWGAWGHTYRAPTFGEGLAALIACGYVLVALGAAWTRAGRLEITARYGVCDSCRLPSGLVSLEVANRGRVKPIDNVSVYVDRVNPGLNARRQLGWASPSGPNRTALSINAGDHAHINVLQNYGSEAYLLTAEGLKLDAREYKVDVIATSALGSKRTRILIDPAANPPVRFRSRWWN